MKRIKATARAIILAAVVALLAIDDMLHNDPEEAQ